MLFVTSRRLWARLSRAAFVVLLAVLLAGIFVYVQNNRAKSASANTPAGGQPTPSAAAQPAASSASAAVAMGPVSPAPAGGPSSVILQPLPPAPVKGQPHAAESAKPASAVLKVPTPVAVSAVPAKPLAADEADRLIKDAQAKLEAGDPVAARNLLNDGIVFERFPPALIENARAIQARANERLVFSPQPFSGDTYSETVKLESNKPLSVLARQHAIPWEALCRINRVKDTSVRLGQSLKTPVGPFHVVVTKSAFRLDLFLGGLPGEPGAMYVTSLAVGLGKDDSTPIGQWEVVNKVRNPPWTNPHSHEKFEGYDPKNPLGGYWIALKGIEGEAVEKTGYGIHGTIDPDSIGKQASMGCVRLKVEDVQVVYDLLTNKSRVLVRK